MVLRMLDVQDEGESQVPKKSYRNTYYCQDNVYTMDGRLYGRYCKNRFCTLCCSIRKADIINRYLQVIQSWDDTYFVTLTVRSVPRDKLHGVMKSMIKEFSQITEACRKRRQRGKGLMLVGIRSLESNFNPVKKTYNPHFHVIVANREMAKMLVNEWLKRSNPGWTHKKAQKISKITDNILALIEVVKYGSKIFTEPDLRKKVNGKGKIYALALKNVFDAMKGLRIFERFGFNLPNENKSKSTKTVIGTDYDEWKFESKYFDWVNTEDGRTLTEFKPTFELIELLENNIDLESR